MEEFDELLWHLVHRHIRHESLDGHLECTEEDLYSVAREAALVAVAKYRADKNTKLSTWIATSVKFALMKSKERSEKFQVGDDSCELGYTPEELEFNITMKQLLSPMLHKIYHLRFVEDKSVREIALELGYSREKVDQCLSHILQRFKLIEESQTKVLTTRRLQDNWLKSSEQSQKE